MDREPMRVYGYAQVEVTTPEDHMGDVIGALPCLARRHAAMLAGPHGSGACRGGA